MTNGTMSGNVALITGASSGIGRAVALCFARRGVSVVIADVDVEGSRATRRLIDEAGGEASFVKTDVTCADEIAVAVDHALASYGRLDYAVNNAGIEGSASLTADYPEAIWRRVLEVNLTGVWLSMKYELPPMLRQGRGAIVNMASVLGTVGAVSASAYVAAKHGVIGITKTAAIEYAAQGIRINAVAPGFIVTPMLERAGMLQDPQVEQLFAGLHPVKRMGRPEEVAEAVVWLCEPGASFVTGTTLLVDGGYAAQ